MNYDLNWKDYCNQFVIQKELNSWDGKCLTYVAALEKIPFKLINDTKSVPEDCVPSGTVKWIEEIIGKHIVPDYFPLFLKSFVSRNVWFQDKWPSKKCFIKPADIHKRFSGFITDENEKNKYNGPFWCSDIVSFQNEWRYYVSYGKLIGSYWYQGLKDKEVDAPKLDVNWPSDFCGAVDFGTLTDGRIELIESHPPFACGWYGKNHYEYAEWLTLGWKWLKENT